VANAAEVGAALEAIDAIEGEGLMLREPQSVYRGTRHKSLLKVLVAALLTPPPPHCNALLTPPPPHCNAL